MKTVILVVEDDALVAEAVGRFLERRGRSVVRARTAEDALDLLKTHKVHAILLDNGLPGRMGLAALPTLQGASGEAPVVVMTGHADEDTSHDALLIGASAVLGKPLDFHELDALLTSLIK